MLTDDLRAGDGNSCSKDQKRADLSHLACTQLAHGFCNGGKGEREEEPCSDWRRYHSNCYSGSPFESVGNEHPVDHHQQNNVKHGHSES